MWKIVLCVFIPTIFSCSDTSSDSNSPISLQAERCIMDGASVYLKCNDGREKIIGLGYGRFGLMDEGKVSEALKFCTGEPIQISVNVKNAHIVHKYRKTNNIIIEHEKLVSPVCLETDKLVTSVGLEPKENDNIRDIKRYLIILTPEKEK